MPLETIEIPVKAEMAQAYRNASPEEQLKIQALLRLRLDEVIHSAQPTREELLERLREIGRKAQERGLTPEILDDILRDE